MVPADCQPYFKLDRESQPGMAHPPRLAYGSLVTVEASSLGMASKSIVARKADARARLRAEGFTAIEAVLHRDDIASLDEIKVRFGITSRSDVLRLVLAKFDPQTLTPEDVALLTKQAA